MLWLGSLLGTLAGILLGAAILIVWVLFKETARRLARAGLRGIGRLCKAPPARSARTTAPDRASVYSLDDARAWRATTGRRGGRDRG
jgi:hypothetical protein